MNDMNFVVCEQPFKMEVKVSELPDDMDFATLQGLTESMKKIMRAMDAVGVDNGICKGLPPKRTYNKRGKKDYSVETVNDYMKRAKGKERHERFKIAQEMDLPGIKVPNDVNQYESQCRVRGLIK